MNKNECELSEVASVFYKMYCISVIFLNLITIFIVVKKLKILMLIFAEAIFFVISLHLNLQISVKNIFFCLFSIPFFNNAISSS